MAIRDRPSWYRTRVPVVWSGIRDLAYVHEPFNDVGSLGHWRDLGYTQARFTGDMYDMRNPEPDWMIKLRASFPWQHWSWSVYRMGPGCVLPNHRDTYARFRDIYQITDITQIWRAIVFLEDWQSGHYFEIEGRPITEWHQGDAVAWCNDVPHLAANVGMTDRYTLQITGIET